MNPSTQVLLFGSLVEKGAEGTPQATHLVLQGPLPLARLLDILNLPAERIQLAMVNHRAVDLGHLIRPGDRVALFPPEYPVFSDWKDFRIKVANDR